MEDRSRMSSPVRDHFRSHSRETQRTGGIDDHDANKRHTICLGHLPPQFPPGYETHRRSSSRLSWDGRLPGPGTRSPSPATSPYQSPYQSPHPSPGTRSHRERPCSAAGLPDHALARPTVVRDRWSYDRARMPSPPPISRRGTPVSDASGLPSSRPASTFIESPPSSRPQSASLDPSTGLGGTYMPSTPTLRVIPPPVGGHAESPVWQNRGGPSRPGNRQSYHLLTPTELEMLSHPPPTPTPPMSPLPSPAPGSSPSTDFDGPGPETKRNDGDKETEKPGCLGLCEIATARRIGGKFGGWLMGALIPISFGLVTACVAAATGCR